MADRDILHQISGDLRLALGLLTRLPLPGEPDLSRGAQAAWAWPLAGLAPAALAALAIWVTSGLGAGLAAALGLAVAVMVTGAMHEDGLADTADGLWGGWTAERRLEIMKDSRIGTYGVIALMLSLLVRWSLIAGLVGSGALLPVLLAAAMLSRAPMVLLMGVMDPARPGGLSRAVGQPPMQAAGIAAGVALALSLFLVGLSALGAALAAFAVAAALGWVAQAKIGGQTGDILGASQQLAEIAALAVLAASL
jgi:adenosylcobinamide-GDP ribazoletransferase